MRRETFNLVIQPLFGRGRSSECGIDPQTNQIRCMSGWRWDLYNVTFDLEAPKSGIKLGGEVRGQMGRAPAILVFLAKEFTIEKFAEFFVGPKS